MRRLRRFLAICFVFAALGAGAAVAQNDPWILVAHDAHGTGIYYQHAGAGHAAIRIADHGPATYQYFYDCAGHMRINRDTSWRAVDGEVATKVQQAACGAMTSDWVLAGRANNGANVYYQLLRGGRAAIRFGDRGDATDENLFDCAGHFKLNSEPSWRYVVGDVSQAVQRGVCETSAAPASSEYGPVVWVRTPRGEDLSAVYPPAAMSANIEGRAVLDCSLTAAGEVTACRVVSETPAGMGFGVAAVTLAQTTMRAAPTNVRRVHIPVTFRLG